MLKIAENCIKCGRCAKDCPSYIISLEKGEPELLSEKGCIRCGHCEAICPVKALENTLMPVGEVTEIKTWPVLPAEEAELFLRSRRSVRQYKQTEVKKEDLERLLDIGRFTQTGVNSQGVEFMVLGNESKEKLRGLFLDFIRSGENARLHGMEKERLREDRDLLFRGAPMLILALTPKGDAYRQHNARYALTYLELLAPSLGLGTCWAGFLENYTREDKAEMRSLLAVPEHLQVSGALMVGYPEVRYYRTVKRNPLSVHWR